MDLSSASKPIAEIARAKSFLLTCCKIHAPSFVIAASLFADRHSHRRNDVYSILWIVVFGFATLNILTLAGRRFEPNRRGMTYGELMAVLVVLLSLFLLGWELLTVFHIFPIKLQR